MMHSPLSEAFQQLDTVLTNTTSLWQPQPFLGMKLPWYKTHPHLRDATTGLSDHGINTLHNNPLQRRAWFRELEPALYEKLYAYNPPATIATKPLVLDPFDAVGIPGRKWQQITAFAKALPSSNLPFVDWCAGKGHLSRVVQRNQQQTVHCLEWDKTLVAAGTALANTNHLDINYHHHDVMQPLPASCTAPDSVHIGLHACGELHLQLLKHVASSGAHALALSPCCYHKITVKTYQPLSRKAQQSRLTLDSAALHLAIQETVTAGKGERELRQRERLWRLGFDELQRDVRNSNEYLPVPSVKRPQLKQDFAEFCQWAANSKNLTLPHKTNYANYLERGRKKYQKITRQEIIRRLFNRPLELWLVLDRALFLEENGYEVTVSQFCDQSITPRNLFIQASRKPIV